MNKNSTYTLSNGVEIPVIGFGTWQTPNGEVAEESVKWAIEAGYRHIDNTGNACAAESTGKSGCGPLTLFSTVQYLV